MTSVRLNSCECPTCKSILDAATQASEGGPGVPCPGDITICLYCQELLTFDGDLNLVKQNILDLEPHERDMVVQAVIQMQNMRPAIH